MEELAAVEWCRQRADDCDDAHLNAIHIYNLNDEMAHAAIWSSGRDETLLSSSPNWSSSWEAKAVVLDRSPSRSSTHCHFGSRLLQRRPQRSPRRAPVEAGIWKMPQFRLIGANWTLAPSGLRGSGNFSCIGNCALTRFHRQGPQLGQLKTRHLGCSQSQEERR
ncbi:MAG: ferritin family protein [Acidimicrobiales bacterium]